MSAGSSGGPSNQSGGSLSGTQVRFEVDSSMHGLRLDKVLAQHLEMARNRVQGFLRDHLVEVDGRPGKSSQSLVLGELVECRVPIATDSKELEALDASLEILSSAEHLVMINKPSGLVVHPGAGTGQETLCHRLLHHFPEVRLVGSSERPGIVHRLDAGTSGVMVIARTALGYSELTRAFSERRVTKRYLAIVYGVMNRSSGTIDLPIGRHPRQRIRMIVRQDGRPAITHWRVLAAGDGISLLGIDLQTGRTHQIRAHLKHIGHPLVGDPLYGEERWRGLEKRLRGPLKHAERPALHSAWLAVPDPEGPGTLIGSALPPDDLVDLWRRVTQKDLLEPAQEFLNSQTVAAKLAD